ncbi:MAG TPA: M20/M25/M40 family metallo-hydrolase [Gaiellales bacterium]|nr:M20/M25/M40 family metallo-hydrolase [Gaiellales bacterium]
MSRDALFQTLSELVSLHSPSGVEESVDSHLLEILRGHGEPKVDGAGNIVLRIKGRDRARMVAVLAHKDEIAAMVKRTDEDGRLMVQKSGGSFPWVWGEGPVEVLGDTATVLGVLSFGSRHVSDESPHKEQTEKAVRWRDAWVETKLGEEELAAAGVRAGSRVVPSAARKTAVRIGAEGEYVGSHAIDDKGSVAGLLALAERLSEPRCDVELVFSAREEIGCHGASWYAERTDAEALVAFEVTPVAAEYKIEAGPDPVLVAADSYGPLHDGLGRELTAAAEGAGLTMRHAVVSNFGSDASQALRSGNVAQTACLAFACENTHGFEIAHLDGITNCVTVLERWLA